MCIIATVCIVCVDTYLNNKSVTHIAIRYIAAMLIVCDKLFCLHYALNPYKLFVCVLCIIKFGMVLTVCTNLKRIHCFANSLLTLCICRLLLARVLIPCFWIFVTYDI